MAEAILQKDANANTYDVTAPEAMAAGEVFQLAFGGGGVTAGLVGFASGDPSTLIDAGKFTVAKTVSIVILDGDPLYWDRSANTATPLKALAGSDFYLGVAVGDAASADTTVVVDLNVQPVYTVDAINGETDTAVVLTAGTPSITMQPGYANMLFSATAEAQKVDILTLHSVPVVSGSAIPFIVEGRVAVYDIGDNAALDFNIGLANATHATSGDTITESVFLHLDGTSLNILAESDDGTTEVAATDTTVDAVDDTYFDFRFDCRDLSDIQIYINGVLVLPDSVFVLTDATGPIKLLAHLEKTSDDTPGEFHVSHLAIRTTEIT